MGRMQRGKRWKFMKPKTFVLFELGNEERKKLELKNGKELEEYNRKTRSIGLEIYYD